MTPTHLGISPTQCNHDNLERIGGAIGAAGVGSKGSRAPVREDSVDLEASSSKQPNVCVRRAADADDSEDEEALTGSGVAPRPLKVAKEPRAP